MGGPVFVEIVGRRIHLKSAYSPTYAAKCKRIVGATGKWDKEGKFDCWTYPLDYTTCLQFRKEFGDALRVGPDLEAWGKVERKRRRHLSNILSQDSFDLPAVEAVAPELAAAMATRAYQQVGAAFMHKAGASLEADHPGLGKTLQIMGAVVEAEITGAILVLAPSAAIQITWPTELRKWLPKDRVYTAIGNRAQRQRVLERFDKSVEARPEKRHWLLCNFEMARATQTPNRICSERGPHKWSHKDERTGKTTKGFWHHPYADLFEYEWGAIIADESQRALITRTPQRHNQTQARAGLGMLEYMSEGLRVAASGTPFRGKIENLWGTLNWLRPDMYTSYWNWCKKWFETFDDGNSLVVGELRESTEEEFYKELDGIMIRRTKAEVAPDLPAKQYAGAPLDPDEPDSLYGIWLDMSPAQTKSYRQMVEHAETELASGNLMALGVFAEMTRLKQFASCHGDVEQYEVWDEEISEFVTKTKFVSSLPSNKFDWLVEWLDERGIIPDGSGNTYGDSKVVIASQFTQLINMFVEELRGMGVECHVLTGETNAKKRQRAQEEFQGDGGPRVFFLNIDAGGVSLTLDKADDMIFLDEKWIPDDQEQVEDRIHRVSRIHQVTVWYVRSLGTIEETIGRRAAERDEIQKRLLDGRRGVEYARKLLGG